MIKPTRFGHCLKHGSLGDRIEGDALNMLGQRLFLRQNLLHVPANRLALTVRVSRENQRVGTLGLVGDRLELTRLIGIGIPQHFKAIVGINRAILWRQIADMAETSQHAEAGAEIFLNSFGLGGGFYDDKFHAGKLSLTCTREGGGMNHLSSRCK